MTPVGQRRLRTDAVHPPHLATMAVRVGQSPDLSDIHCEGLALTASYLFEDAEDAAEKFASRRQGNVYIRFHNPTTAAFEQRLAAMEGAEAAIAVGSGMAAYLTIGMALFKAGDHVILGDGMFGTTYRLFGSYLDRFGVASTVVDMSDLDQCKAAIRPTTVMMVLETPTNPVLQVADLSALAGWAEEHGILLTVDNTLCTPVLQNPISFGADLVVHSAGKYIDGQGRCGGGIVAGGGALIERLRDVLRAAGPSLSPFNSWILLKSLETLPIRMRAHSEHAQKIALRLQAHPAITRVYYTGLPNHPQHDLACAQQTGHGGLISFAVSGDRVQAWRVIDRLELISNTTNIGDTKSMITHPYSTTHGRLPPGQKAEAGITENMLRLSVGLEDPDDVFEDLSRALDHSRLQAVDSRIGSADAR